VNLKQKTFLFVLVSMSALLAVYVVLSSYYVSSQKKALLTERTRTAQRIGEELTEFFTRGLNRLKTVTALPGLVYGLQTLTESNEGKQIPAWTTLHYLFYESDVFREVYLINGEGKVLWSEPPDQDLIESSFDGFDRIVSKLGTPPAEVAFLLSHKTSGIDIQLASPLLDPGGQMVGLLVGTVPHGHPLIRSILRSMTFSTSPQSRPGT
jgi:hypothetical protein